MLTKEGVACVRPSYEILVGGVVDHPIKYRANEQMSISWAPGQRLDEETHSYSFWRKAGTSCLAGLFKWDELPLGATVSDICWSVVADIVVVVVEVGVVVREQLLCGRPQQVKEVIFVAKYVKTIDSYINPNPKLALVIASARISRRLVKLCKRSTQKAISSRVHQTARQTTAARSLIPHIPPSPSSS